MKKLKKGGKKMLKPEVFLPFEANLKPPYLNEVGGRLFIDKNFIHEGGSGPYDFIANYEDSLFFLQEPTAINEWPEGVEYMSRKNPLVEKAFKNLTLLVATGVDLSDIDLDTLYVSNFVLGLTAILQPFLKEATVDTTLLAPLNGGQVAQEIAKALGFKGNLPQIKASRVILENGHYLVGIREETPMPKINSHLLWVDDCRAAAGSEDAGLRWALSKNPKIETITSVIGVGLKRSSELLFKVWRNNKLNYRSIIGAPVNAMNNDYYLVVTNEEKREGTFPPFCRFRVGDMGLAMNLKDDNRREILLPVIKAVALGKIHSDLIFEATQKISQQPEELAFQAQRIRQKAKVVN